MKPKILFYLSLILILLPGVMGVGDTFAIVQGSAPSIDSIYFKVYDGNSFLFDSYEVGVKNDVYALSITVPAKLSEVILVPVVNSLPLDSKYNLHSGETLRIDVLMDGNDIKKTSSSSVSSSDFQPEENKQMIEDISKGVIEPYEEEVNVMPLPKIVEEPVLERAKLSGVSQENPLYVVEEKSFLERLDKFFLQPLFLLISGLLAIILIILILKREYRSEYL